MRRICCIAALAALGILAGSAGAYEAASGLPAPCCAQHVIPALCGQGGTMPADFTLTPGYAGYCCESHCFCCDHIWDNYCQQKQCRHVARCRRAPCVDPSLGTQCDQQ
jgi:hypothetical protein